MNTEFFPTEINPTHRIDTTTVAEDSAEDLAAWFHRSNIPCVRRGEYIEIEIYNALPEALIEDGWKVSEA